MIRVRGMVFRDEDDAHDYFEQRDLDDADEAKRAASGFSPEQLSLQDAFLEGTRAGVNAVNPFQPEYPEHDEWERGRLSALGMAA